MTEELSSETRALYEDLLDHVEESADGWGCVYLANLKMSGSREFAGRLAALEAAGLYRSHDGVFGYVKK